MYRVLRLRNWWSKTKPSERKKNQTPLFYFFLKDRLGTGGARQDRTSVRSCRACHSARRPWWDPQDDADDERNTTKISPLSSSSLPRSLPPTPRRPPQIWGSSAAMISSKLKSVDFYRCAPDLPSLDLERPSTPRYLSRDRLGGGAVPWHWGPPTPTDFAKISAKLL